MKAKPKKPSPKPINIWVWLLAVAASVVISILAFTELNELHESASVPAQSDFEEPAPIRQYRPHHTHTKDAAETARLNRQMLEEHTPH